MKISTNQFIMVEAEEGFKLTTYQEGEDILNFSYFSKGAFPSTYDISKLREITLEEVERLTQLQEEAIENEETE